MHNQSMIRGAIYGIGAATIWGSMYVVSDVVLQVIPPFTLLTLRIVLALIAIIVFTLKTSSINIPSRSILFRILFVGIIGMGLSLGSQFVGTDKSTAVNGALVTSASPAFIVLFAVILLRERLTMPRFFAIILASIGVIVILNPSQADFSSDTFIGDMFLASAAVTWGLYSVLIRRETIEYNLDTNSITIFAFVGGLIVSLPASVIELSTRPIGAVDGGTVIGILYLGIISTAVATWLWNRSFALVPATVASLFFFAQPLSGAILASLFLGQPMTKGLWIGGGLIALGVLLSLWQSSPKQKSSMQ
jgi:drug/metabolite transporter (DMT)-like permease